MSTHGDHPVLLTRRRLLATGGAVTLGALLASCSDGSPSGPTSSAKPSVGAVTLDDVTRSSLDTLLDKAFAATGLPGVTAAIWIGSQSWQRTRGVRDLASGQPFHASDHVRIASITKSFTGTAVLQLVDQGLLKLDDPLEKYVPGIANGDRITVADMAGMRSGIYDFTSDQGFGAAFDADPTMTWSDERTLAIIKANQPSFEPGAQVVYADSNYALLGMIIEQVTGEAAGRFITAGIVNRLALHDTSYPTAAAMPEPHPTAYVPDLSSGPATPFDNMSRPPKVVNEINPAIASTAGAMVSTLADLKVWGRELSDGTLLKPATQQARLAASKRLAGQKVNLGYGLGLVTLNEFLGHDGAIYGYSTIVLRRPRTDTTIVVVSNESTNSTTPAFDIAFQLVGKLYPDQVL